MSDVNLCGRLKWVKCAICDNPATCIGRYEMATADEPACDDCCGHGCEDGHCTPIEDVPSEMLAAFATVTP
jgi:hypothetical protein